MTAIPVITITACPRCDALTEEQAATMCQPHGDDCPMCCREDWNEALAELNRLAVADGIERMEQALRDQEEHFEKAYAAAGLRGDEAQEGDAAK